LRLETIILNRKVVRSDKILSVFSRELGKIVVVAPGCAKVPNRFGGAIEPLNYGISNIYRSVGGNFYLREYELKKPFWEIRRSLNRLESALFILSLVDKTSPLELPEPELFDTLLVFLDLIDSGGDPILLRYAVILKIFHFLGFLPSLDTCSSCSGKISKEAFVKGDTPILVCGNCAGEGTALKLTEGLNLLQEMRRKPLALCGRIKYTSRGLEEVITYLEMLLRGVLGGVGLEFSGSNI